HEWHDSTLLPFEAGRYSARYEDQLTSKLYTSLTGAYTQALYTDLNNHVNTLTATAQAEARLTQSFTLLGRVTYLDDQDDLLGNTRGLEEMLEARWKHRQTEVFGRIRNANLESSGTNENFTTLEVGLRRNF